MWFCFSVSHELARVNAQHCRDRVRLGSLELGMTTCQQHIADILRRMQLRWQRYRGSLRLAAAFAASCFALPRGPSRRCDFLKLTRVLLGAAARCSVSSSLLLLLLQLPSLLPLSVLSSLSSLLLLTTRPLSIALQREQCHS